MLWLSWRCTYPVRFFWWSCTPWVPRSRFTNNCYSRRAVRIPMHLFLIQFLTHFRLSPLQCVPNVFRVVMGTVVQMEKLGLQLTVHDITYVYRLQATSRKQYTLVAHNSDRNWWPGFRTPVRAEMKISWWLRGIGKIPLSVAPLFLGNQVFAVSHTLYFHFV